MPGGNVSKLPEKAGTPDFYNEGFISTLRFVDPLYSSTVSRIPHSKIQGLVHSTHKNAVNVETQVSLILRSTVNFSGFLDDSGIHVFSENVHFLFA